MVKVWMVSLGVLALVAACGDDGSATSSGGGSGGSVSGSGTSAGSATTMASDAMTSVADEDGTSASTGSSNGTTAGTATATATTDDGGSTSTAGTSTGGSEGSTDTASESSSGGPPEATYPPCDPMAEPPCPEPYTTCFPPMGPGDIEPGAQGGLVAPTPEVAGGNVGTWCTFECMDDNECPDPTDGDATPVCAGMGPGGGFCMLDCSAGTCPAGMMCLGFGPMGMAERCAWPPA